jgi:hypothetical protein
MRFRAAVQYGDFEGTASADNAGDIDVRKYLKERDLIKDDEFLLGTSVFIGENHGPKQPIFVQASAYLYKRSGNFDDVARELKSVRGPIPVRVVTIDIENFDQFVLLFKRFDVTLTLKGLDLIDREYTYTNEG